MNFRDRTDITELLILFSSIMKLGIVLGPLHMSPVDRVGSVTETKLVSVHMVTFRKVKRNLRLFKQRKWRNYRQAGSLDFTPEWSRHHFFKFFMSESGLKVTI